MRIQNTSIGAPMSSTSSPALARTIDLRPSQPTVSVARTSSGPSGVVARTPAMRPPSSMRSTTLACMISLKFGIGARRSARKSRKSHCGISAMNACRGGRKVKSAMVIGRRRPAPAAAPPCCAAASAGRRAAPARPSPPASRDGWCRRGNRAGSRVLLQHDDVDAGAGEQQAEHHAGRAAAGDAAGRRQRASAVRRRSLVQPAGLHERR